MREIAHKRPLRGMLMAFTNYLLYLSQSACAAPGEISDTTVLSDSG